MFNNFGKRLKKFGTFWQKNLNALANTKITPLIQVPVIKGGGNTSVIQHWASDRKVAGPWFDS